MIWLTKINLHYIDNETYVSCINIQKARYYRAFRFTGKQLGGGGRKDVYQLNIILF